MRRVFHGDTSVERSSSSVSTGPGSAMTYRTEWRGSRRRRTEGVITDMAERGAQPPVPRGRRLFLRAIRHLFKPLEPDDYLEMINPMWTTKEVRGKVEGVEPRGAEAASIL